MLNVPFCAFLNGFEKALSRRSDRTSFACSERRQGRRYLRLSLVPVSADCSCIRKERGIEGFCPWHTDAHRRTYSRNVIMKTQL